MRMMVWKGWRGHRACWPRHAAIKAALIKVPNVAFVFGEYDKIIPVRNANRLRRMTRNQSHVTYNTVRSGHNLLKPETMDEVVRCIFGS